MTHITASNIAYATIPTGVWFVMAFICARDGCVSAISIIITLVLTFATIWLTNVGDWIILYWCICGLFCCVAVIHDEKMR